MVSNSTNHNSHAYRHKLVAGAAAANEPCDKPCSQDKPHCCDRLSSVDDAPPKSVTMWAGH